MLNKLFNLLNSTHNTTLLKSDHEIKAISCTCKLTRGRVIFVDGKKQYNVKLSSYGHSGREKFRACRRMRYIVSAVVDDYVGIGSHSDNINKFDLLSVSLLGRVFRKPENANPGRIKS